MKVKLRCHRPTLASAFQVVGSVVPTRTSKEVLRNIKLQMTDQGLTLIGTDMEVGIRHEVAGAESDGPGELLLPTQRITAILRELPDEHIEIESTAESVVIRSAHSEFQLGTSDPAEFPAVTAFDAEAYYVLQSQSLRQMIRRTVFATDTESTRYALGGVLWDFNESQLTLAATDSRRLAVVESSVTVQGEVPEANSQPVIPSKAMNLLERSLADEGDVQVAIHGNDATIKSGETTIYCRLVEGRFPRYRDVIPNDPPHSIDLVVGPLFSAVRQSLIVTNEESRGVQFEFREGQLTLISRSADIGASRIELPVSYAAEDIDITLEPRFVSDFLKVLDAGDQVKLQLTDGDSPVSFATEDQFTYVVMPLTKDR